MENRTVLIIDDDEKLHQLLKTYLERFSLVVHTAVTPSLGVKLLQEVAPDIIILDIMLPEMDGFETCQKIRQQSQVPIIMLTARGDVMDRVVGLEMGADDYLPKPFEPRELVARIQSILRRSQPAPAEPANHLEFGNLSIDLKQHQVQLDDQFISLSTQEFEALALLVRHAGEVLTRDQILDALRGIDYDAFNRSVDITMSRLRQKLGDDPKNPQFIKTIWGTGYAFIAKASTS